MLWGYLHILNSANSILKFWLGFKFILMSMLIVKKERVEFHSSKLLEQNPLHLIII